MMRAKIIGSGMCLPPFRVNNKMIGDFFPKPAGEGWTPDWVERKLGIKERRNAFDFSLGTMRSGYYDLDNAYAASLMAMQRAGVAAEDIERVIYVTSTPEYLIPDPACMLHMRLGLHKDSSAIAATAVGCGGFIYAMDIADSEIRSTKYRTILVVGSVSIGPYIEAIHKSDDPMERQENLLKNLSNAYIFGEGAGAMVLRGEEGEAGVRCSYVGAYGQDNPVIFEAGGSRYPATHETVRKGLHRFNMNVGLVKNAGPVHFAHALEKILERSGMSLGDIDHFIFHQVNFRLLRRMASNLHIPWEKMAVHVDRYGNLDTATLPVAYHEESVSGRIKPGETILFAAIGAGWQYGAMIVQS